MRRVDEEFLWNTTHVDAGSAEITVFGHSDTGAMCCGEARRAYASRARPDHKEIKLTIHQYALLADVAGAL